MLSFLADGLNNSIRMKDVLFGGYQWLVWL